MLKLAWLGPPSAAVDDLQLHFETRKATALLAYLSLNPNKNQRQKLAALFWPEFDQSHALANLRRALGSIMRTLPPGFLEADRETLCWIQNAPSEIDVLRFQANVQTVRAHHSQDAEVCRDCLEILDLAADLYRGEFLEGLNLPDSLEFDDWQYLTREELRGELAWSLERLARGLAEQGAWEKAASTARRWITLDRLDASAQSTLVEIYARSGQHNPAQRQMEEYFRLYTEEFGEQPDEAVYQLFRQALHQSQPGQAEGKTIRHHPAAGSQVLLKTKTYRPNVKTSRVSRPRLLEKLDEIVERKLTLVCAPAGFGKTSLLAEWAAQTDLRIGWLSLDGGDDDPHYFLSYLCAAFNGLQAGVADNTKSLLESIPPVAPQTVITVLLKDLEPINEPLVLVLDDYQFISTALIHDTLIYFLERAGPNLHLVIASRANPPLPLARLRAAGELLEVRTEALRFNLEECSDFLNQAMQLDIAPADVQTLADRTEGWAVGLQMAAILLQDAQVREKVIQNFSGSHRYILEYLIQEVLDRQPEHVRDFLIKTSILNRLCSDLCDAVIGQSPEPAYAILEYLERSNLFLIPLDQEQHWFRYHHLFADLLGLQLQRFPLTMVQELHLRSSSWYEENGHIDPAIEHALRAKDFERVANLLEQDSQSLGHRVGFSKLQHWIDRLPSEMVLRRGWIAISQAWLWLLAGKVPDLVALMNQIEEMYQTQWIEAYPETDRQDQLANIKCLRAYIAFFLGDLPGSIVLSREALQHISPGNEALRVRLLVQNGELNQTNREYLKACEYLYPAIDLGIRLQDFQSATTALMRIYRSLHLLGKLNQAEAVVQKVIQVMTEAGRMQSTDAGKPALCWGDLLRERGHREESRKWLDQGLRFSRLHNIPFDTITAIVYKVKWFYSEQLWDEAQKLLDEGVPLLNTYAIPPPIEFSWWLWKARVCLEIGDAQTVLNWIDRLSQMPEGSSPFALEESSMVLAKLNQRDGKHAEALARLENLASEARSASRYGTLIPNLILQAISLDALGQSESALNRLEECLHLAQPEQYLTTFLEEGPQVETLLQALRARDLSPVLQDYTDQLIRAFAQKTAFPLSPD